GGASAHAPHLDQGCGQEAAQSDVDDQAALDDLDDGAGDNAIVFLDLLDVAPGALVLSALLREHETAFLVLLLENEGLDLVPDLDDFAGIDIVLDGQLAGEDDASFLVLLLEPDGLDVAPALAYFAGIDIVLDGQLAGEDDAFRLVSDVNEDLVAVNLDDGSFDDVTIVEVLDGLVDGGEKFLSGSDVIDSDLLRLHRFRRGGGHIGRDSDGLLVQIRYSVGRSDSRAAVDGSGLDCEFGLACTGAYGCQC